VWHLPVAAFEPGQIGAQDAEPGGRVGIVELARLAVAASVELDDAEIAEVNPIRIGG